MTSERSVFGAPVLLSLSDAGPYRTGELFVMIKRHPDLVLLVALVIGCAHSSQTDSVQHESSHVAPIVIRVLLGVFVFALGLSGRNHTMKGRALP